MRKILNLLIILSFVSSCTIIPRYSTGYYSTYIPTVFTPSPIITNPYIYRPYPYYYPRTNYWYNPPRPRSTTIIINSPTPGYGNHHHSGPRGGRRK